MPARAMPRNASLVPQAAGPAPSADAGARRTGSMSTNYTNAVTLEMLDVAGKMNNGARLCIADAGSLRAGEPARNHALSTLQSRALNHFQLPRAPKGTDAVFPTGLKGPDAHQNPTSGASWAFVAAPYANTATAAKQTVQYVSDLGLALLKQAFLEVDLDVPAETNKSAWGAKAERLTHRVKLTRTGEKIAGGSFQVVELVNFRIALASNLPKTVLDSWKTFAAKYPEIVTLTTANPGQLLDAFRPAGTSASTASAAGGKRPQGRTKVAKTIAKKPSRR